MKKLAAALAAVWLAGCAQTPATLPDTPTAAAFKEAEGPWVSADPGQALPREDWWKLYQDPDLDQLQQQLLKNSPDLASALARYREAQAATNALRAAELPTVGLEGDASRNLQSQNKPLRSATSPDIYTSSTLGVGVQYEVDLWGRIRRQVEGGVALEQAAQADLASAQLALQVQLTDTLIALRGADEQVALLRDSEDAYARAEDMVARRHDTGIASGLDLAQAQTQLEATRSQLKQAMAQRSVLEHAIAALVGANASAFSLEPKAVALTLPVIPVGLPSTLLQRRPDIAAAQRRVISANANVGVAKTAFFPSVMLGATGGFQSDVLSNLVSTPNFFWTLGPTLMLNVFDGGRRKAEVARAQAQLDEAGQNYRSVVLGAFQQVEDQLTLLNRYGEAAASDRRALDAARRAMDLATNRYKGGAASYLDVVAAQTAALQAERSALDLATRQRRASVQLVRTLGGGWSADLLAKAE